MSVTRCLSVAFSSVSFFNSSAAEVEPAFFVYLELFLQLLVVLGLLLNFLPLAAAGDFHLAEALGHGRKQVAVGLRRLLWGEVV